MCKVKSPPNTGSFKALGSIKRFKTPLIFKEEPRGNNKYLEEFSKVTAALPNSPDLTSQLTSLTFETKVPTLYKTTNSQATFT